MWILQDYKWYKKQKPVYLLSFSNFYKKITRWDSMESILYYKPPAYEANKLWEIYLKVSDNPCSKIWFLACYRKWMRWDDLFSIRSKWCCVVWYSHKERRNKTQELINQKRKEQGWYKNNKWEWLIKNS